MTKAKSQRIGFAFLPKNNKCYKQLYENWEKKKRKIMMWTLIWLNKSIVIINATLQLLDIYRYRLKIKSIK